MKILRKNNMKVNLMIIDMRMKKKKKNISIGKLSNLRLHKIVKQIELTHLIWDFDAVLLCLSAMWDSSSI